ncbi:MAG: hypothetical protein K0U40_02280 [Betaproteobacteria bacterium]|nr:hypothetical protein [Betaproteobacteria bacterium]
MKKERNIQTKIIPVLIAGCFLIAGCAGPKPILYPNAHLNNIGQEQADRDIAECQAIAKKYLSPSDTGENIAISTVRGAGMGAASGAVGGAISGSAGSGSMIGAAAGATFGLIRGLFQRTGPNRTYTTIVDRCLVERGYETAGWDRIASKEKVTEGS